MKETGLRSTTKKRASDIRAAGLLFAIGGLAAILLIIAAEAAYPRFDYHSNALSDLSAHKASTFVIGEAAGLFRSIPWMLGGFFQLRNTGREGLMALAVLPGVTNLFPVLSPEDVNVVVHSLGSPVTLTTGLIIAYLSYKLIEGPVRLIAILLGLISFSSAVIMFSGYWVAAAHGLWSTLGLGGWESLSVLPPLLWLTCLGAYMLTKASEHGGSP